MYEQLRSFTIGVKGLSIVDDAISPYLKLGRQRTATPELSADHAPPQTVPHANKVEPPKEIPLEDYGRDHAYFNGVKVEPQAYRTLYHGANPESLGLTQGATFEEMATHIFTNGLSARGKMIDLEAHQKSHPETAFRGTTTDPISQGGDAGAAHWAGDDGVVIHLKNQVGYDLNELHATSSKGGGIGGMVNQKVYGGEQEISIPAYVKPEDIVRVGYIKETDSGRKRVEFMTREEFLKQGEKDAKK